MSLFRRLFTRFGDAVIRLAQRTPYTHLAGYMERWWLFRFGRFGAGESGEYGLVSARVHHILRSDNDRHFHDHPWPFVTVILRGGYWEQRPVLNAQGLVTDVETQWHGPGSILFRRARDLHRLVLPVGSTAWTLFMMGPKVQTWGFHVDGVKVPWRDYLGEQGSAFAPEVDHASA